MQIERAKLESIRRAAKTWLKRNLEVAIITEASKPPVDNGDAEAARIEEQQDQDAAAENAKALVRDREHHVAFRWDSEKLSQEFNLGLTDEHLKVLAYHIAQANVVFWQKLQSKELVSFEDIGSPPGIDETNSSRYFSDLVNEYLDSIKRDIKEKSLSEYRTSLKIAQEIIGDPPMTEFTRKTARALMDGLYEYPVNRTKGKKASLGIEEIKAGDWKPISATTVDNHHSRLSSFFNWCVKSEYFKTNFFEGLGPSKKLTKSQRRSFEEDELKKLFSHSTFQKHGTKAWQYWLPILGFATGARIEELAGLRGSDITKRNSSCWYIDIHERSGESERTLKNNASVRRVPVHNYLIELGLCRFAESRGNDLLFHSLTKYSSGKLSHEASKWFGRLKNSLGFGKDLTFHSFRHTMRDMLSNERIPGERIKAILGHDQGDVTFGTYGSIFKAEHLNLDIQKLPIENTLQTVKQRY